MGELGPLFVSALVIPFTKVSYGIYIFQEVKLLFVKFHQKYFLEATT